MADQPDETTEPVIRLTGGTMEVHQLGGDGEAPLVDRPDVALRGLGIFNQAIEAAGGQIEGDVHLRTPDGGLRLIRGGNADN